MDTWTKFTIPVLLSILVLSISSPVNNVFAMTEDAKLIASDAAKFDNFGISVSISISEDTVIVGAFDDDDNCPPDNPSTPSVDESKCNSGSAYVFTRSGTTWTQQAKLTASDAAESDFFGHSVSISGDTIIVGSIFGDGAVTDSGAAYVFTRSGTTWTQQAKLTASDAAEFDNFGFSVSISGDTVIVGSVFDDDAGLNSNSGSAYVFTRSGTIWTQQAKLTASDAEAGDWFGHSVSISRDTIIVGSIFDDDTVTNSGSAYVFEEPIGGWVDATEDAKLTASDAAESDKFGYSVSISGDTVIVGSAFADDVGTDSGSAYVFEEPIGGWVDATEDAKLTASDAAALNLFGFSVSISGDTIIVGAFRGDDAVTNSGSAYVFEEPIGGWVDATEDTKLKASDAAASDVFGVSVSISGDTAIVGARANDDAGTNSGSAYVYEFNQPPDHYLGYDVKETKDTPKFDKFDVTLTDQFGTGVFEVKKPERLYNPVDKNGEGISDPITHLVGYKISTEDNEEKDVVIVNVLVTNQFGKITLDVKEAKLLLVPSAKDLDSQPEPLDSTLVDHYKCYKVKVTKGTPKFEKITVDLTDQFESKTFEVKKPKMLCNPVQKTHDDITTEIIDEENHLLCYDVKPAKGEPKHEKRKSIFTNNQFGPEQLDTKKEKELCVPSVKT